MSTLPIATIQMMDNTEIQLELYPDVAPNTVANFISLAQDHFFDGLIFHRIVPDYVIQGGDPTGLGQGAPSYTIKGEFANNGFNNPLSHTRGVISMARWSHYDSAGSQFFIVVKDAPTLDGNYAAFGKVIQGLDIVDTIVSQPRNYYDMPRQEQQIKTIRITTFEQTYPVPHKLITLI